jgi:predicted amidohydrolase YtcJ
MLSGSDKNLIKEYFKNGIAVDSAHWLTVRSLKLYSDGALGSRGAWLLAPYSDRHEMSGMPLMSMDTVLKVCREALESGFQVCTHAIGDRANREILDRYELALKENPDKAKDARFRIEHSQHIDPQDIPRFAKLGVIPAMQAIHLSSDRPWAIDRLGEKRIKEGAYMWQSLLKSGAYVVNGTDVPVEPINPIACYFASVTRQTLKGEPAGGYEPEEKMTRAQALKSYTLDAAYGAFEENIKGSIEVGKLADFTIFSQDLMAVPDDKILSTEVAMTIVGGKVAFEKK